MTTFDDRKKGFEEKFAHDNDLQFRVINRRNKLLGLWAADQLGKHGPDADAYAKEVVLSDFEAPGDDDVIQKIAKDFAAAGVGVAERQIRKQMEHMQLAAKDMIMKE
jgi:hypothetical protein